MQSTENLPSTKFSEIFSHILAVALDMLPKKQQTNDNYNFSHKNLPKTNQSRIILLTPQL